MTNAVKKYMSKIGKRGGKTKSKRKSKSSKRNGKLGGRPRGTYQNLAYADTPDERSAGDRMIELLESLST